MNVDSNYDNGDKLSSVTWSGGSKSYGYDAAGRLETFTSGGVTTTLGYDHDNRVTSISRSGMTTNTFVYNGFGTRTSKTDSTGPRTYLRDGVGVTSPVLSDGAATYTPGISERRGTTSTYQLNGLKSTFAQSNASGGHVSSRNYDAFGAVTSSSGTHQGPFGYGGPYGYQTDPDTGLMLLGHRFYDPSVGRFLTRDPIKDGRNWYGYGGGYSNPVRGADPDGLLLLDIIGAIGAGYSWYEFGQDPSWSTFGLALLDTVTEVIPFIPGSSARHLFKLWPDVPPGASAVPGKKGIVGTDTGEPQITKNRRKGLEAEEEVRKELEADGWTIIRRNKYFKTPFGRRFVDWLGEKDGAEGLFEVKSGESPYEGTLQSEKDDWITSSGLGPVVELRRK